MEKRDYCFVREDGLTIRGRLYAPDRRPFPVVVVGHAFGSNYRVLEHLGPLLGEKGIGSLFFDYCGGGRESVSDGAWEDMTCRTAALDMKTVVQQMDRVAGADTANIFVMGRSLGGLVSALVAAELPDKVRGAVLWYPALELGEKTRSYFPDGVVTEKEFMGYTITRNYFEAVLDMDPYAEAAAYEGPVLILHGDRDDVVPLESSLRAQRMYKDCALLVLPGAGHGFKRPHDRVGAKAAAQFILDHMVVAEGSDPGRASESLRRETPAAQGGAEVNKGGQPKTVLTLLAGALPRGVKAWRPYRKLRRSWYAWLKNRQH